MLTYGCESNSISDDDLASGFSGIGWAVGNTCGAAGDGVDLGCQDCQGGLGS